MWGKVTKTDASRLVFLEREVGYWAQLVFSDSRVPPWGSFTYCSDGRNRGNTRKSVQTAIPDSSLHYWWRKEWWYPFKPQYPQCKCVDRFFFCRARPTALKRYMIHLTYNGENAHDLEFGIIASPPNPISWEVVYLLEKKTTARMCHVNYHKAEKGNFWTSISFVFTVNELTNKGRFEVWSKGGTGSRIQVEYDHLSQITSSSLKK